MKKIKRLFLTVVLLALCLFCIVPFAGCNTYNVDDWKEVQSITYTTDSDSTTLTSTYEWNYESEYIEFEEYEYASYEQKKGPSLYGEININKDNLIPNPSLYLNKIFYYIDFYMTCRKCTLTEYKINYVKVKFSNDNAIEINYNNKTSKVLPVSYNITYFTT